MVENFPARIGRPTLLSTGLILITIAFQKGASDPLNPIKLWLFGLLIIFLLADLLASKSTKALVIIERVAKQFTLLLAGFCIAYLLAFLHTPLKSVGFLGDSGRNLGLVNYLFLAFLTFYTALKFKVTDLKAIYVGVFILSAGCAVYGIFQHYHTDFLNWNNLNNPIILMTGNPDFAASLLGIFSCLIFAAIFTNIGKLIKFCLAFLLGIDLLVIFWTQARQGLLVAAIGIGFILLILCWEKSKVLAFALFVVEIPLGLLYILGTLQIGPFTNWAYKASVNDRGYNWQAAIEMFKSHPFFGVGVDRYGAFFYQYRAPKYPLIYGYTQTVTNAHNVFLEIFATAGIFTGIFYLSIIFFIAYRAYRAIRNSQSGERLLISGIVAGWIGYVAQSIISVDVLALSIWGWVFGGAIVAVSYRHLHIASPSDKKHSKLPKVVKGGPGYLWRRNLAVASGLIAWLFIVVPMYRNETETARFAQIQAPSDLSGRELYRTIALKTFHQSMLSPSYKVNIAILLAKNGYIPESIAAFKEIIKIDPRNTDAYSLISIIYEDTKNFESAIPYRKQLAVLDPYGAENLVKLENDYLLTGDKHSAATARDFILKIATGTDVSTRASLLMDKL
jgi:O-antigen ligase